MKQHYDKVLLAIALVLLLVGLGMFFARGGMKPAVADSLLSEKPSKAAYEAVPVPPPSQPAKPWAEAPAQDPEGRWVYGVFTPPKIWVNTAGAFMPKAPKDIRMKPKFGLVLRGFSGKPYRIQLSSVEEGARLSDTTIGFLVDGFESVRAHVGDAVAQHGFTVVDFKVEKRLLPDGSLERKPVATIRDDKAGGALHNLSQETYQLKEDRWAVLATTDDPAQTFEVREAGKTLELPNGVSYIVKAVNFDEQTVTVEKHQPEWDPETRTLSVEKAPVEAASEAGAAPQAAP